jgi:hypothetical protein
VKRVVLALAFCVAMSGVKAASGQTREDMERDYVRGFVYLITKTEAAYEKPDLTSKQIGTVTPTNGLLIYKVLSPDWIQVNLLKTFDRGWVRLDKDNVIRGDQLTVLTRLDGIKNKKWSPAVRLDILRGRARIGFTKEQVEISRQINPSGSDPVEKQSEETAAGLTEIWKYPDAIYTFNAGKVVKINKTDQ